MRWNKHIDKISNKAKKRLSAMIPLKLRLRRKSLEIMYQAFVKPIIDYCSVIWGGSYDSDITKLEQIQVDALHLITGPTERSNVAKLYEECPKMQVRERIDISTNIMIFKIVNRVSLEYLSYCLPDANAQNYN